MSIEYLNKALQITGLTPTKKFILVVLANYADEKGTCYPSYKHIAKKVGLKTHKGVQKTIKEFEQLGYLRIEHRLLENKSYTSNKYHLTLGGVPKDPSIPKGNRVGTTETPNTKENTKDNINPYCEEFEKLWKVYPRGVGKKQANKVFGRYDEKHYMKIIYGAERFAEDNLNTEEKYIPHLSTWLNQERWMDYFETDEVGSAIRPKERNTLNNLAG